MPTKRPTYTGLESKGKFNRFLEPVGMAIIMGTFTISMMLCFLTVFMLGMSLLVMVPLTFIIPNAVSVFIVFALIQGKPQGYPMQWVRSKIYDQTVAERNPDSDLPPIDL
jgi:hypothetical protein